MLFSVMVYINACLYFSFICFCVNICVSMFVCPRSVICIRVYVFFMFFTVLLVFVWILLHVLSYRWAPFHFPFTLLLFELLNTFISYYLHLTFLLIFLFFCVSFLVSLNFYVYVTLLLLNLFRFSSTTFFICCPFIQRQCCWEMCG